MPKSKKIQMRHFGWFSNTVHCLKITTKVSFYNIASEASYVYIWRVFGKTVACGQTVLPDRSIVNWTNVDGKCQKSPFECSIAILAIFGAKIQIIRKLRFNFFFLTKWKWDIFGDFQTLWYTDLNQQFFIIFLENFWVKLFLLIFIKCALYLL